MNEWKTCTVQYLVDLGEAEVKTGPFGTQLHASDYVEVGIPVINVRNIGFGDIRPEKLEYISEETAQKLSSHLLQPNDIVFGRKGAVERHVFIKKRQDRWFQGSDCLRIRLTGNSINPRYISYCFLSVDHKTWMMNQCSHGATMASLNQDIVKRIPLRLPSLQTQNQIAAILSAYDDLIENNTRRIKVLEEMAQMIYREWFVKCRFPGHEKVKMVDSVMGKIPEGWAVAKVGELLEKTPRKKKIQKQDYIEKGEFPVVDQGKEFIGGYTSDIEAVIEKPLPLIVFGDHTRILKYIDFPFACGADGTQLLKANTSRMPISLFYYALLAVDLSNFAYARHFKFLKEEQLIVPDQETASMFEKHVSKMHDHISCLTKKNHNLRQTRDLLLPKLISGEVDVEKMDIAGGEA